MRGFHPSPPRSWFIKYEVNYSETKDNCYQIFKILPGGRNSPQVVFETSNKEQLEQKLNEFRDNRTYVNKLNGV